MKFKAFWVFFIITIFSFSANSAFAYNASYVLGQTLFTTSASGVTSTAMNAPRDAEYDADDNLLYVLDYTNNRVLVYNVADITSGEAAVNVLGQNDFTTSAASTDIDRLSEPAGLALDSERDLLFVSQAADRISIFDVSTITDGEDAVNFLGFGTDLDPTSTSAGPGQNAFEIGPGAVAGMYYDETNELLYLADIGNHRVLVFNMSVIVNGENAVNVLGQTTYGAGDVAAGTPPSGFSSPSYISYIEDLNYLAVSHSSCISIFDVSSITDGESAVRVIGEDELACNPAVGTPVTTRQGFVIGFPYGSANNSVKDILYVADPFQGVKTFDSTAITTGEDAVSIISQATFDDQVTETSQSRFASVVNVIADEVNNRLFAVDETSNRVMVFEFMNITDGSVLTSGTVGAAYSDIITTENDQGMLEFMVTSGTLPPGLSFTGATLSGTPTTEGDYSFSVRATDVVIDDIQEFSDTASFSMSIAAAPSSGGGGGGSSGSKIRGCMDIAATNYNSRAKIDNGTCAYAPVSPISTPPSVISCPVFTGYAKIWSKDNDKNEVMKIQNFLNEKMGESLKVDGTFGLGTYFAVKRFQEKYYTEIIVPWQSVNGLDHSTGWWHTTTSARANILLGCPVNVNL